MHISVSADEPGLGNRFRDDSHSIGSNDSLVNYYTVVFGDYQVQVTTDDLMYLGYKLERVNGCIVKVTGRDFTGFFMCYRHIPDQGLLATVGAEVANSPKPN